jgi:hypothetical protein
MSNEPLALRTIEIELGAELAAETCCPQARILAGGSE